MKKRSRLLIVAGIIALIVTMVPVARTMAAAQTVNVYLSGSYDQTGARSMLQMINDLRANKGTEQGDQAWYYAPDNSGNKIALNDLKPLVYDYELEAIAKQRAAEIAVRWSHTRPDGSRSIDIDGVNAENIAYGRKTAAATFEQWLEADEDYAGQGHRRNMLGGLILDQQGNIQYSNFLTSVGIAHFVYNGQDFWVQEFGAVALDTNEVPAADGDSTVTVTVDADLIDSYGLEVNSDISVAYHETYDLTKADVVSTASIYSSPFRKNINFPMESAYTWESLDLEYATVSNNQLRGEKAGTGKLNVVNDRDASKTVNISVTEGDIANAGLVSGYDGGSYEAGFSFVSENADLQVYMGDEKLTYGKDYLLLAGYTDDAGSESPSYSYTFKHAGKAYIKIKGTGNYIGISTETVTFDIVPANLKINAGNISENNIDLVYGTGMSLDIVPAPGNINVPLPEISFEKEGIVDVTSINDLYGGSYGGYFFRIAIEPLKAGTTTAHIQIPEEETTNTASNDLAINITVSPCDISGAEFVGLDATYEWTGSAVTPVKTCRVNGVDLEIGKDFTVEYYIDGVKTDAPIGDKNTKTVVTVKAVGTGERYAGTAETSFTISPLSLKVQVEQEYPYRADGVKPVPVVTHKGVTLTENVDYTVSYGANNVVGKGNGSVTVTGTGAYAFAGDQTAYFDITEADITDAELISGYDGSKYKTGFSIDPNNMDLKVVLDGNELTWNKDYSLVVDYQGHDTGGYGESLYDFNYAGQVKITVAGKGNYKGTSAQSVEFTIEPADLHIETGNIDGDVIKLDYGDSVSLDIVPTPRDFPIAYPEITFEEEGIVQAGAIHNMYGGKYNGYYFTCEFNTLKEGATKVHIRIPEDPQRHTASNELILNISVTKKDFAEHARAEFTDPDAVYIYTAPTHTFEPDVKVTVDGTRVLVRDSDYVLKYADNIYAGKGKVTIVPIGAVAEEFSGSIEKTFDILTRDATLDMAKEAVFSYAEEGDIEFRGAYSSETPEITVSGGSVTAELTEFSNGQGKIHIRGTGIGSSTILFEQASDNKFTGASGEILVTVNETVLPEDEVAIELEKNTFEYTGSEIRPEFVLSTNGLNIEDRYYTYKYTDNIEPGEGKITVQGANGLVFTKSVSFEIVLADTSQIESNIEAAKNLLDTLIVSDDGKYENGEWIPSSQLWVTQNVYDELKNQYEEAVSLISSGKYTAEQVSSAAGNLSEALSSAVTESNANKEASIEREKGSAPEPAPAPTNNAEMEKQAAAYALYVSLGNAYEDPSLPRVSIKAAKKDKKAFTPKWKKLSKKNQKKIKGIEYEFSPDPGFSTGYVFKSAKKASAGGKKIKVGSGKTYYVRAHTYVIRNGAKYVSPWSRAIKVKTK